MKIAAIFFLLLTLSAVNGLNEIISDSQDPVKKKLIISPEENYSMNNSSEKEKLNEYKIEVDFLPDEKLINVVEDILWFNNSKVLIDEIYFTLTANGCGRNNRSKNNLDKSQRTSFEFSEITLNGKPADIGYKLNDENSNTDSSIGIIKLAENLESADSTFIHLEYKLLIPKSSGNFGYADDRNFFLFTGWYPKISVFRNGNWESHSDHPFIKPFSEFADCRIEINLPNIFKIAAPGIVEIRSEENQITYISKLNCINDFTWSASDNIITQSESGLGKNKNVKLNLFIQPENNRYSERYLDAMKSFIITMEKEVGSYPFHELTLVDLPRESNFIEESFPALITVKSELISPVEIQKPEYKIAALIAEQYFGNTVGSNPIYESWLSKGISAYFAEKIVTENYGNSLVTFRFAGDYPIMGINLLSYNEVPVIYSVAKIIKPVGTRFIEDYYKNITFSDIASPSFELPTYEVLRVASVIKPQIALLTLENLIGEEQIRKIFSAYFNEYKFKHPNSNQFINIIEKYSENDLDWFYANVLKSAQYFDYSIRYLKEVSENNYELFVERKGDGIVPVDIEVYTENDTILFSWNGEAKYQIFKFELKDEVVSAQIDPDNNNLLDINFANNSYIIENKYWGSLSLSVRTFFWFQNALMIFGSI